MKLTKIENDILQSFKRNLRRFRKKRGFSLQDLSDKTGISLRMLSYYENHILNLPVGKLEKISSALNVSINKLLDFKNETSTNSKKKKKDKAFDIDFEHIDSRTLQKLRKLLSLPKQDRVLVYSLIDSIYSVKIEKKLTAKQKVNSDD